MAVIAVAAIAFTVAERLWPYNEGQPLIRTGFFTDMVWHNFIQT